MGNICIKSNKEKKTYTTIGKNHSFYEKKNKIKIKLILMKKI
jgi:hypothetical protein